MTADAIVETRYFHAVCGDYPDGDFLHLTFKTEGRHAPGSPTSFTEWCPVYGGHQHTFYQVTEEEYHAYMSEEGPPSRALPQEALDQIPADAVRIDILEVTIGVDTDDLSDICAECDGDLAPGARAFVWGAPWGGGLVTLRMFDSEECVDAATERWASEAHPNQTLVRIYRVA